MTVIPIVIKALGIVPKGLGGKIRGIGNQKKNRDHPDYDIIKLG